MDGKLIITREEKPGYISFNLEGRIDAYWSKYLDEALDNALREREYNIALDLRLVEYLSSLGIRSLIKYAKLLKGVNGTFGISECSKEVMSVLNMVGLAGMLEWKNPENTDRGKSNDSIEFEAEGFTFRINEIEGKQAGSGVLTCRMAGNPEGLINGFSQEDCTSQEFGSGKYGLGLGAIGSGFSDCETRFGEFVAFGDAVAFMPSGEVNTPDFMLKEGNLTPSIKMLYGILLEGSFGKFVRFSPTTNGNSISMSKIMREISKHTNLSDLAMVMMAESTGMVGVAVKRSPAVIVKSGLFSFPQIKENLNLTTEPEYSGEISLSLSVVTTAEESDLKKITRDAAPGVVGFENLRHHTHSAIFAYRPITKSELKIEDAVRLLFEEDKIESVLHLINDRREATGAGESEFSQGVCWVGKIDKQINK